ncbi:hypothetical protein [Kocuria palustris]|uniref:hypothetical protein n=1 Tax=Kocuria palustris TaxID=71999 RepID=UPI0011A97CA4|nr:hypothetical protein [Kocuria palustris]
MADQPRPTPSPSVMRGRRDPALSVEPVDWTPAPQVRARQARQEAEAARRRRDQARHEAQRWRDVAARIAAAPQPGPAPAPEDALYTVDTGAPAPTARGSRLRLSEDRVHVVGAWDATLEQMQAVVDAPDDVWTADLGRTDHFLRGELCVQVTRAEGIVVGIYRSGWATARRPEAPLPDEPGADPRASGKQGTRYPTTRRELLKRLRGAGFEVATSGPTHGKITHPDHPGRFLPFASTPSTHRHGRHVVTAVRRVFGIDLRD